MGSHGTERTRQGWRLQQVQHNSFRFTGLLPWLLRFTMLSTVGRCLQIRTSILKPWKKSQKEQAIGWIREVKDEARQTYHVQIGLGEDNHDTFPTQDHDHNKERKETSVLSVPLPFMVDETALGATMWPSGLAAGILSRTDAIRSLVQDKKVLELGAGLGLPGRVLAMQGAQAVELTDYDQSILEQALAWERAADKNDNDDKTYESSIPLLQSRKLDWRDADKNMDIRECFDIIVGTDVAYYFYLLRPLMDTIQRFRKPLSATCMIVGPAHRKSLWDLYKNIRNGSYNQLTDQYEDPWDGKTQMLLYNLRMNEWKEIPAEVSQSQQDEEKDMINGVIPIAVLLHEARDAQFIQGGLTSVDYIADEEDEKALDLTF